MKIFISILICLLAVSISAFSNTYKFTGSEGPEWSNPKNWDPEGVPSPGSTVIVTDGGTVVLDQNAAAWDMIINGSSVVLSGHSLQIGNDLIIGQSVRFGGHLIMADPRDALTVNGDAIFLGNNNLAGGTITFMGNVTQGGLDRALQAEHGGTRFVFADTLEQQLVTIANTLTPNGSSWMGDVTISNPYGVVFKTDVQVKGELDVSFGGVLIQEDTLAIFYAGFLPEEKSGQYLVSHTYVDQNMQLEKSYVLPSTTKLTVLPHASLTLNGHRLTIAGDMAIVGGRWPHKLVMTNPDDRLTVEGDAYFQASAYLTAGEIHLRGNLYQSEYPQALRPDSALFIFDGYRPQRILLGDPAESYLDDVIIANPSGVEIASNFRVDGQLTLAPGAILTQGESYLTRYTNHLPEVAGGTYRVNNTIVNGKVVMEKDLQLSEPDNHLTIPDHHKYLSLGGHTLEIGGDFHVAPGYNSYGSLHMDHPADRLTVHGDARFELNNSLTAGDIELKGNLYQGGSTNSLRSTGTRFIFSGDSVQSVHFQHPGGTYFEDVVIQNPDSVVFANDVIIKGRLSVENGGMLYQPDTLGTYFKNELPDIQNGQYAVANTYSDGAIALDRDVVLPDSTNNLIIRYDYLDLNAHRLTVGGNLIVMNEGWLVNKLIMESEDDTLTVNGDAYFRGQTKLSRGVISLYGDLIQEGKSYALRPESLFHFYFAGDTVQTISFTHPTGSWLWDVTVNSGADVRMNSDVTVMGAFSNRGRLEIPADKMLRMNTSPLAQLRNLGGTVVGSGTVWNTGNAFENRGRVNPGAPLGQLRVVGDYFQAHQGTLNIELGGYTPEVEYDRLKISDNAHFDGSISVQTANGFVPVPGDSFRIVTYGNNDYSCGAREGVLGPGLPAYTLLYKPDGIDLIIKENPNSGTTVIVHGLNPKISSDDFNTAQKWVTTMATAIAKRTGAGQVYEITDDTTGNILPRSDLSVGTGGEKIIILNWLIESWKPIFGYAEAAGDALAAILIEGAIQGKWNLEQLHVIGHSRGAIVSSELIQRLGLYSQTSGMLPPGITIDPDIHFTTLDPHPWDNRFGDHVGDPGTAEDHDVNRLTINHDNIGVLTWENVGYADNYTHNRGFHLDTDLNGMPEVPGFRFNKNLTDRDGINHSGVHAWYHGTIDYCATDDGATYTIDHDIWYPGHERFELGFNYAEAAGTTPNNNLNPLYTISIAADASLQAWHIFNGDFTKTKLLGGPFTKSKRIPGWEYQGGDGDGDVDKYELFTWNRHLELDRNNLSRRHNYFYIPQDAEKIWFRFRVPNKSRNDVFRVLINDTVVKEYPITKRHRYRWESVTIPAAAKGKAGTIEFALVPQGATDSEVWIDDVNFRADRYLNATVAANIRIHAYDADGNHTGPTSDTTWAADIPGSRYLFEPDSVIDPRRSIILPAPAPGTEYTFVLESADTAGVFNFQIEDATGDIKTVSALYENITLQSNTIARLSLATVSTDLQMSLDRDGDGHIDASLPPTRFFEDFAITASVAGQGSISIDTAYVNYGDSLRVTITPDSGYQVVDVIVDSVSIGAVSAYTFANVTADHAISVRFDLATGIGELDPSGDMPLDFALSQNYPNPFNPTTTIRYQLPEPANVSLVVYNLLGQQVRTLVETFSPEAAGYYQLTWDGRDNSGSRVASGMYLYRLSAQGSTRHFIQHRKMVLLK